MGNARWRRSVLFLRVKQKRHELLDRRHGNVASIVARKKRLALQVEEEDSRRHCAANNGEANQSVGERESNRHV